MMEEFAGMLFDWRPSVELGQAVTLLLLVRITNG